MTLQPAPVIERPPARRRRGGLVFMLAAPGVNVGIGADLYLGWVGIGALGASPPTNRTQNIAH